MSKVLYSDMLSNEEKIDTIVSIINDNKSLLDVDNSEDLFGSRINIEKLDIVLNILKGEIEDNDLDKQDEYFQILDKIIDGAVSIRYDKTKKDILYSDIVAINDDISNCFKKLDGIHDEELFEKLITKIYLFTGKTMDLSFIKQNIESYYRIFEKDSAITLIDTSYFCNLILNHHRNYYMSNEKKSILEEIPSKLELSSKRKKTIINNEKIRLITNYIESKEYDKLHTTEEEFDKLLSIDFNNDKNIKKSGLVITEEQLSELKNEFKKTADLSPVKIKEILEIDNEEIAQYISKKYTRVKAKYFSKVKVDVNFNDYDAIKTSFTLNPTNFMISNSETYKRNVAKILLMLNNDLIDDIIYNKKLLNEIKYTISFCGLIDEYSVETIIKILSNYGKIVNKLGLNSDDTINTFETVLEKMGLVIKLANGYASIDDILIYSFGGDVITKLGESVCFNYKEIYKNMLNRIDSNIPPVEFTYNERNYKSGNFSDPERLLLGKMYDISCIDLDNPGEATYRECLEKNSGDAILIRDKMGNLIDRILLIRRGNVVQIIMKATHKFPIELYQLIGKQIITQSVYNNDNIEYVVVASSAIENNIGANDVFEPKFISLFPHADLEDVVCVVGQTKKNIEFDFEISMKGNYPKIRKHINDNPSEYELTRLRALRIMLENDEVSREEMARSFNKFIREDYSNVVCGEDWYIAQLANGDFEELVLPTKDSRSYEELEDAKVKIFSQKRM